MNSILTYLQESVQELHKVRWPTRQQAIRLSIIVICFVAVSSIFFGFTDYVLNLAVTTFINI